jgi:hypothetical protein
MLDSKRLHSEKFSNIHCPFEYPFRIAIIAIDDTYLHTSYLNFHLLRQNIMHTHSTYPTTPHSKRLSCSIIVSVVNLLPTSPIQATA